MDRLDPKARSALMSKIRAKDTKPELIVRRYLHRHGLRYRLHDKGLPGTPDLVFRNKRIALFVHGCFWHGHSPCRFNVRIPKTDSDTWRKKIEANQVRDLRTSRLLSELGWEVLVIWECELSESKLGEVHDRIVSQPSSPR